MTTWKTENTICDPFVDVRTEILTAANGRSSGAGAVGFAGIASRFAYSESSGRCAGVGQSASGGAKGFGVGGGNSRGSGNDDLYPDLFLNRDGEGRARGRSTEDGSSWGFSP